jgi:beta-glucanase (GH16 family)
MNNLYPPRLINKSIKLILLALSSCVSAFGQTSGNWQLVWSDEFSQANGSAPNSDNWNYDIGGGGWGNQEIQYYTNSTSNAREENGMLIIEAREENFGGRNHTSARLKTQGKHSWQYGKFEARVKVPSGSGLWPAVWMLGTDIDSVGWPQCGEIDIMEFVGREPYEVFGTIHGPGYAGGNAVGQIITRAEPISDDFHIFSVEWDDEEIRWYFDGEHYFTADPTDVFGNEWVYDHEFFIIMNLAIGGTFGGTLDPNVNFPKQMLVDYIRVYAQGSSVGSNVLANSGFENASLSQWTGYSEDGTNANGGYVESTYNTYYNGGNPGGDSVLVRNGNYTAKVFGDFSGVANDNGIYQEISTEAGTIWSADAWALTHPQDLMSGDNSIHIEVSFRDANDAILELYRSPVLTASSITPETWTQLSVSQKIDPTTGTVLENDASITAPSGTQKVRYQANYNQPLYGNGSIYFDDLSLVLESNPARTLTATANSNGSITPSGETTVADGANQTYTITPDPGYVIANVLIDGVSVGAVSTYTFQNIQAPHSIVANFTIEPSEDTTVIALDFGTGNGNGPVYTGTFDGTSGFIPYEIENQDYTYSKSPSIDIGDGVILSFTNINGWNNSDNNTADVGSLLNDHLFSAANQADDPVNFTLSGLSASDTVIVEFAEQPAKDALVNFNGIITTVNSNGAGFVDVSNGGVTGSTSYNGNFTAASGSGEGNLAAARITIIPLSGAAINASASNGGSINPAGIINVASGEDQSFSIAPDNGYRIADVIVNGSSIGTVTSYTFNNVTTANTISVSFELIPNDYDSWINNYSSGANTAFSEDLDGDGLSNGLENILGTDPTISNSNQLQHGELSLAQNGTRNTNILNAGFEDGSANWSENGANITFSYPSSGGNPGRYATISDNGGWGILITNNSNYIPLTDLGMDAGNTYSFQMDMRIENGSSTNNIGGLKIDFFNGASLIGTTNDMLPILIGDGTSWETYTFSVDIPVNADSLKLVLIWGNNASIGYDNIAYNNGSSFSTFSFSHAYNANSAEDISVDYKWSTNLPVFHSAGVSSNGNIVNFTSEDNVPSIGEKTVTAIIEGELPGQTFFKLEASKD